jgi:adenosylmethionine-8-amino-7-oxononanoate aminotransferase
VLLRPIGDVVYFMPPYVIGEDDVALMARTAIAGIELASRD